MAVRPLRKIQIGVEATKGTAVPATRLIRASGGMLDDRREIIRPAEDIGMLVPTHRSFLARIAAGIDVDWEAMSYEELLWILDCGVKTVSGVQDGTGSDYIWTYDFPTTAANSVKTYTIEAGDDQQAEEMEYGYCSEFSLEGEVGGAMAASASFVGRQVSTCDFTGAISIPEVNDIQFYKGELYIDDADGTIGTTQVTDTLLRMSLGVTTGWMPWWAADGNLYFAHHKCGAKPEVTLDVTFEHNASAVSEKGDWRTDPPTPRLIRLLFEGPQFATPGTTYTYHTLIIDLAGEWERFEPIDEIDGNDVIAGTFRAGYDPTATLYGQIVVVNELSSFP